VPPCDARSVVTIRRDEQRSHVSPTEQRTATVVRATEVMMRTRRIEGALLAIGVALALHARAVRADAVPPIRPEQEPAAAASPAHGDKGKHSDPAGATAQCKDGAYSHATHRSHTCRHHGGVAKWLDGSK